MTSPVDYTCYLTNNRCYKANKHITPKGIMVHSTGANNPMLKRYVQSRNGDQGINTMLGVNKNANDWNRSDLSVCVHAFIGRDALNNVRCVQTLPWDLRGWHAGSGLKGSANDTHISFEICEDDLHNEHYFNKAMAKAQDLCAYLCMVFNLNPSKDGVIICHQDGYKGGIASNHGDIYNWLNVYGLDMIWFREEVKKRMVDSPSDWAVESISRAKNLGISDGDRPLENCSREEVITMLMRMYDILNKE